MNNKLILTVVVSVVMICSVGVFASKFLLMHPDSTFTYNEEPQPVYTDNTDKQQKDFVSDDECLGKIGKTKLSHIKSSEIKTWGQHQKDEKSNAKFANVSDNRMVKIIKVEYPDGLDTKAGFYKNAILTAVFDAQTGNLLESSVTGDYVEGSNGKHPPLAGTIN